LPRISNSSSGFSTKNVGFPFPSFGDVDTSILNNVFAPALGDQTFTFTLVPLENQLLNLNSNLLLLSSAVFSILTTLFETLFPVLSGLPLQKLGYH
jgi:hypothetical protein